MKQNGINFAKNLAFGMWCEVKVVASCCMLHFCMMNSVPNFSDRLSYKYIYMYRKLSWEDLSFQTVRTGFKYPVLPSV